MVAITFIITSTRDFLLKRLFSTPALPTVDIKTPDIEAPKLPDPTLEKPKVPTVVTNGHTVGVPTNAVHTEH